MQVMAAAGAMNSIGTAATATKVESRSEPEPEPEPAVAAPASNKSASPVTEELNLQMVWLHSLP